MRPTHAPSRRRRLAVAIAGISIAALALTTFTTTAADASTGTSVSTAKKAAKAGGTLNVDLSAAPTCLDPGVAFSANERAVVRTLVDSLVDMQPKTGKILPWLAKSWTVNSNATKFTFHLRSGMTFSDGTPVDANAVKSTFDYVKNVLKSTSSRGAGYLSSYTGTTVVNPLTAEVDFSAPSVQFLAGASTSTLGILSTSSAQKTTVQRCAGDYVGSGPFTLKSYTQGQSADVVKRSGYDWSSKLATHTGTAYLNGIDFQVVNVSNARDGALSSKQTDVAIDVATQDVPQLKAAGVTAMQGTQPGLPASFVVNTTIPGLSDPKVRQAMEIGFDRVSDVKAVLGTYFKPATSILTANLPEYSNNSSLIKFNAKKAKSILQSAGWVAGSDGIRAKGGVSLNFGVTYTATYGPYYTSLLQLFQQQMKAIGIGITLDNLTQAGQTAAGAGHKFDLDITSLTDADPDIIRSSVANYLFPDPAALNTAGITTLFTQSQADSVQSERNATYAKIQKAFLSNGFVIPFWEGAQLVGYGSNVKGLRYDFQSWLNFYDVSLSK